MTNNQAAPERRPANDVLFRVETTWASKGREGRTDDIIAAPDAVTALSREWGELEDPRQLRSVHIEWLTPVSGVFGLADDPDTEKEKPES